MSGYVVRAFEAGKSLHKSVVGVVGLEPTLIAETDFEAVAGR